MEITTQVNFEPVQAELKKMSTKKIRAALRKALRPIGPFWVQEAKSRAPVSDGFLRDSIASKMSSRGNSKGASATLSVGPAWNVVRAPGDSSQQPAVYAPFVEGVKPLDRKMTITPFMRPTFDSTADKVVKMFADALFTNLGVDLKDQ